MLMACIIWHRATGGWCFHLRSKKRTRGNGGTPPHPVHTGGQSDVNPFCFHGYFVEETCGFQPWLYKEKAAVDGFNVTDVE